MDTFLIARSEYGTQNFVRCGWCNFNRVELDATIARLHLPSRPQPPAPVLLFQGDQLVGFVTFSKVIFGSVTYLMKKHMDGSSAAAVQILIEAIPHITHAAGCDGAGGYSPCIDWLLEIFDSSEAYKRPTQTEQWEYHWRNADLLARMA
uniref:Uncharacterized protein n=1 Tax=Haptolina ericina TaxID=156174 RepID=A0A7S3BUA6_9EUKA